MKRLYIIKAGSTFADTAAKHGDFEDMTLRGLGLSRDLVDIVKACNGEGLPAINRCSGVIITGAHCMVTDDLPWSLAIEAWVPALVEAKIPLLGICYGHQLLGRAMGGQVGYHPQGKEVGTVEVRLRPASLDDRLFKGLPERFPAHATHAQSVLALPPGAIHLAENAFEPHHAFRLGSCAWGVQFHPEYDSSVMRDYILAQTESLIKAGIDIDLLLGQRQETFWASSLLKKFAAIACS